MNFIPVRNGENRENYDLCINSANYGLKDTIELIQRMLDQKFTDQREIYLSDLTESSK